MVCDAVGSHIDAGPFGEPNERPYIERFFGTIGSTLSNRLPGTTGYSAQDVRRALSDPGAKTQLLLSTDELAELLEVSIANYNGTPHDGLGGRSPLEAMAYHIEQKRAPLRILAEPYRRNLLLLQPAHVSIVRGNLRRGVRPYVNLYGVPKRKQSATDRARYSTRRHPPISGNFTLTTKKAKLPLRISGKQC